MRWPFLLACVVAVSVAGSHPAFSESIRVEAEAMTSYSDLGGLGIVVRSCSAASEGLAIDGLDRPGEWIKIPLEVDAPICFVDSLRSAGSTGAVRTFAIHIESNSPSALWAADTVVTPPGSGVT